jgi:hypothetical protein
MHAKSRFFATAKIGYFEAGLNLLTFDDEEDLAQGISSREDLYSIAGIASRL